MHKIFVLFFLCLSAVTAYEQTRKRYKRVYDGSENPNEFGGQQGQGHQFSTENDAAFVELHKLGEGAFNNFQGGNDGGEDSLGQNQHFEQNREDSHFYHSDPSEHEDHREAVEESGYKVQEDSGHDFQQDVDGFIGDETRQFRHGPEIIEMTKVIPVPRVLKVPVPRPVKKPITIPVPVQVPEPYLLKVAVPVTVEKTVEVPVERIVKYNVDKPVPLRVVKEVKVPVPKPVPVPVPVYKLKIILHSEKHHEE